MKISKYEGFLLILIAGCFIGLLLSFPYALEYIQSPDFEYCPTFTGCSGVETLEEFIPFLFIAGGISLALSIFFHVKERLIDGGNT